MAAVRRLVGQDGIYVAVAQAGLIETQVLAEIAGIEDVILCMAGLIPCTVIAYLFLVLLAQGLSVKAVATGKGADAYRSTFNLPLLKKPRTPH